MAFCQWNQRRIQRLNSALSGVYELCKTSLVALSRMSQIWGIHCLCWAFISTERRQVTVVPAPSRSRSAVSSAKNARGSSATARCRFLAAAASKIFRERAADRETEWLSGRNMTMSSSGANAVRKRSSPASAHKTPVRLPGPLPSPREFPTVLER